MSVKLSCFDEIVDQIPIPYKTSVKQLIKVVSDNKVEIKD